MKQTSITLLIISIFSFSNLTNFAQNSSSIVIDYSYSNLPTSSCNVFSQPLVVRGYEHQSSQGFPYFTTDHDVINLKCIYQNRTEYSIKFPFKKGYKYTINAYAASSQTAYPGQIGVKISSTNDGQNSNTDCSGGPPGYSDQVKASYAYVQVSTAFSWINNLYQNYTADADYSYLLVSSFATSSQTGLSQIMVQKIQILETPPTPVINGPMTICSSTYPMPT